MIGCDAAAFAAAAVDGKGVDWERKATDVGKLVGEWMGEKKLEVGMSGWMEAFPYSWMDMNGGGGGGGGEMTLLSPRDHCFRDGYCQPAIPSIQMGRLFLLPFPPSSSSSNSNTDCVGFLSSSSSLDDPSSSPSRKWMVTSPLGGQVELIAIDTSTRGTGMVVLRQRVDTVRGVSSSSTIVTGELQSSTGSSEGDGGDDDNNSCSNSSSSSSGSACHKSAPLIIYWMVTGITPASMGHLSKGLMIESGDKIGEVDNGYWHHQGWKGKETVVMPPRLHVQCTMDLLGYDDDRFAHFPTACIAKMKVKKRMI